MDLTKENFRTKYDQLTNENKWTITLAMEFYEKEGELLTEAEDNDYPWYSDNCDYTNLEYGEFRYYSHWSMYYLECGRFGTNLEIDLRDENDYIDAEPLGDEDGIVFYNLRKAKILGERYAREKGKGEWEVGDVTMQDFIKEARECGILEELEDGVYKANDNVKLWELADKNEMGEKEVGSASYYFDELGHLLRQGEGEDYQMWTLSEDFWFIFGDGSGRQGKE